ncbi:hypothetical protein [Legionella hackeliae]|uniref:Uncharacterized protein n=1 Tax=Legionella hackeliae TaxID=449 RepID=A0A0A8UPA6_LEGHA|nr:hypothetical protein [Legionella hackeliae]KTD13521.1 hypothetical protein Lhac_0905 [Legionella hackeliae]CEK09366.1 exported protein of unknown function [Legionella hackeliae]STX49274.1 Uncharacterised protein [Legionella hackeliae]
MLRTLARGILLGAVVTTTSVAGSLTPFFLNAHLPKSKIQHAIINHPSIKDADFSGNWSGTCTDIEGEFQLEIQQLENFITINGYGFKFGAITTFSSSDTDFYHNSQLRLTWDPKKTALMINGTSLNADNNGSMIYTSISETSMALNNDQLLMTMQAKFYSNLNPLDDTVNSNCVFTKAP